MNEDQIEIHTYAKNATWTVTMYCRVFFVLYWQGDEEKWTASFSNGNGRIFISKSEWDESTGIIATQVSAPVFNQGKTIGVLIVGIKINYFKAKKTGDSN